MALPTPGVSLSLSQIQGEFGGANPISMSEYYAGGTYVPAGTTGSNGAVPANGTISISQFYGTSNIVINFSNEFISAGRTGAAATASYRINNDGFVYYGINGTFTSQYQWITPTSAANDYEVYATLTSGIGFTAGTFDAWVAVSGDPTWTLTQATIGTNIADVIYHIRTVGTATVLDTWTAQFEAERN